MARQSQELMGVLMAVHYTVVGKTENIFHVASSSTEFPLHPPLSLLFFFQLFYVQFALFLLLILHCLSLDELCMLGDGLPYQEVSGCCTYPQKIHALHSTSAWVVV